MGKYNKMPKSLNEIRQKIIEMIFEKLKLLGIKDIYLTGVKIKKNIQFLTIKNLRLLYKNFKTVFIYSWYSFYKTWNRKKKNLILLHSDLFFDNSYLSLLKKKKHNIVCCSEYNRNNYKPDFWMCTSRKNNLVNSIVQYKYIEQKVKRYQISCINKFSSNMLKKFFPYMKNYFSKYGINDTWEVVLNKFIQESNFKIYLYKNSRYWFNINTLKDLNKAKNFFNKESRI